jgi:ABC-type multidrug transport system fused ATPase/permease subunit
MVAASSPVKISFYFKYLRQFWRYMGAYLLLSTFSTIVSSILPISSKFLIDYLTTGKEISEYLNSGSISEYLPIASFNQYLERPEILFPLLLVIFLFILIAKAAQNLFGIRLEHKINYRIHSLLFERILRFPIGYIKKKQVGYLMSRISYDTDQIEGLYSRGFARIITNGFYLITGFVILWQLNRNITVVLFCLLPLQGIVTYFFSGQTRNIASKEMAATDIISNKLHESFSGIEVIKANTAEDQEIEKVSRTLSDLLNKRLMNRVIASLSGTILSGVKIIISVIVIWLCARAANLGKISVGDVAAFATYSYFLAGISARLCLLFIMTQPMLTSWDRIHELIEVTPESRHGFKHIDASKQVGRPGNISFQRVNFSYDSSRLILKDINLEISQGDIIAITGISGAGKTTLINLLLKFNYPQSGHILIDGSDINDIDSNWLRKQIGMVSQDVFLFNDTVENNIKYGNQLATREQITQAATLAHIHDDIIQLPQGYQTKIGERGYELSAGQRQRISIARTILRNPSILILDEPSSALDEKTEKALTESILKENRTKTIILVSHRTTMLSIANRVIKLEDGKLVNNLA